MHHSRSVCTLVSVVALLSLARVAWADDVTATLTGGGGNLASYAESGVTVTSWHNDVPNSWLVECGTDGITLHFGDGGVKDVFSYGGVPFDVVQIEVVSMTGPLTFRAPNSPPQRVETPGVVQFTGSQWSCIPSFQWHQINGQATVANLVIRPCPADTTPPVLTVTSPPDGSITSQASVEVDFQVTDDSPTTVTATVSGAPVPTTPNSTGLPAGGGTSSLLVPLPNEGENVIVLTATDSWGNSTTATLTIFRDTTAPTVSFVSPTDGAVFGTSSITVSVSVTDDSATTVQFGGQSQTLPTGGGTAQFTYVATQECSQTLTVVVTDAAGNTSTATVTIYVDLDTPVVTINSPADGAILGPTSSSLPVSVTVDECCACTVTSNPAGVSGALAEGGGTVSGVIALSEGYNTITVSATDRAGHVGSASITVILDTTPPNVSWVYPVGGEFLRGTVQFAAKAQDPLPGSGVARVELLVDSLDLPMSLDASGNYATSVDTTQWTDGTHLLTVKATDGVGNSATASCSVVVDNTPPIVSIVAPTNGSFVCEVVTFTVAASDATSGLAQVSLYANGSLVAQFDGSAAAFSTQLNTRTFLDGPVSLSAVAVDRAGNSATSAISVISLNSAPKSAFVSPLDGQSVTGTITIQANVTDLYLRSVEFFVNGASLGAMSSGPFVKTFDTLTVLDGALTIQCVATDMCGNLSTQTIQVYVHNMTFVLDPQTLNLPSKGGKLSVTGYVEGKNVKLLLPSAANQVRLVLPDGSSIPTTLSFAGADVLGDYNNNGIPDITLKFDRQALIAAIQAGVNAGRYTIGQSIPIRLLARTSSEIGIAYIRIIH